MDYFTVQLYGISTSKPEYEEEENHQRVKETRKEPTPEHRMSGEKTEGGDRRTWQKKTTTRQEVQF